jgi:hypothetical protein
LNDCPNYNLQQEHIADIAELKAISKEHEKKIDKLDEIREAVIGIKAFLEFSKDDAHKRDELLAQQSEVLNQISTKLTSVSGKVDDLDTQVSDLKEKYECSEDKSTIKIDTRDVIKSIFKKFILPAGAFVGVAYGLLKLFKVI